jgi:peptidoglycan/xylan/chitin deacetylase (PgdA/CDA1 family)
MIAQKYKKNAKLLAASFLNKTGVIRKHLHKHSILILMYHRVNESHDFLGLTVNESLFSRQVECILENFEVISLDESVTRILNGSVDKNYCVITFDDGYRDNFEIVAPILEKYRIPATIFVTYDAIEHGQFGWKAFDDAILNSKEDYLDLRYFGFERIDLRNCLAREKVVVDLHGVLKQQSHYLKKEIVDYVLSQNTSKYCDERFMLNWDEVCKLSQNDLFTIGAHTITHPILSKVSETQAIQEIVECKVLLEDKIKNSVNYFAYPNGGVDDYNANVISIVKNAGYRAACTTVSGNNIVADDLFELKRVDVTPYMSTDSRGAFNSEFFLFSLSQIF